MMAKPFEKLREEMTPERRQRNQLQTELALLAMALDEIRQHRQPTELNGTKELPGHRTMNLQTAFPDDMLLSTLVNFIAEMGGTLKLVAQFPDEEIVINQFQAEVALPQKPSVV